MCIDVMQKKSDHIILPGSWAVKMVLHEGLPRFSAITMGYFYENEKRVIHKNPSFLSFAYSFDIICLVVPAILQCQLCYVNIINITSQTAVLM